MYLNTVPYLSKCGLHSTTARFRHTKAAAAAASHSGCFSLSSDSALQLTADNGTSVSQHQVFCTQLNLQERAGALLSLLSPHHGSPVRPHPGPGRGPVLGDRLHGGEIPGDADHLDPHREN